MKDNEYLWQEYLDEFSYFTTELIRSGCHPMKMIHPHRVQDSIVLIHGLTDSPGMMADLANWYHKDCGYNVYMPLLQCHGLKDPDGMHGVSLWEWKKNVRFAVQEASAATRRVSVGGLSTGGALAMYFGALDNRINHTIHLFSAALGLSGGWFGTVKKYLLRSPLCLLFMRIKVKSLVGQNPYRYRLIPLNSARELVVLMGELEGLLKSERPNSLNERPIFNAWTECDNVVDTSLLASLEQITAAPGYTSFVVDKRYRVEHACIVLQYSIYADNVVTGSKPLEQANPVFKDMVEELEAFIARS